MRKPYNITTASFLLCKSLCFKILRWVERVGYYADPSPDIVLMRKPYKHC